jgi:hypothetical protein
VACAFIPRCISFRQDASCDGKASSSFPGVFDGEHYFKLEAATSGGVLFRQGENFAGLLVPMFRKSLDGATKQGFIAMNEALKREAEGGNG